MQVEFIKGNPGSKNYVLEGRISLLDELEALYEFDDYSSKDVGEYCHLNEINPFKVSRQFTFEMHRCNKVWPYKNEIITIYSALLHLSGQEFETENN